MILGRSPTSTRLRPERCTLDIDPIAAEATPGGGFVRRDRIGKFARVLVFKGKQESSHLEHILVGLIQHSAPTCVTHGLDPRVFFQELFAKRMDCRVKPGSNEMGSKTAGMCFGCLLAKANFAYRAREGAKLGFSTAKAENYECKRDQQSTDFANDNLNRLHMGRRRNNRPHMCLPRSRSHKLWRAGGA